MNFINILISNSISVPLYEQIIDQIKNHILKGTLTEGEILPSIRQLAKDLNVSIITTKRAYEELENQGFICTVGGKGSFVSSPNPELLRDIHMREVESHLEAAIKEAKYIDMGLDQIKEILTIIFEEEQ